MTSVIVETRLPVEPVANIVTLPAIDGHDPDQNTSDSTKISPEEVDIAEVSTPTQLPFDDAIVVDSGLNVKVSIQAPPTAAVPSRLQYTREAAAYLSFFLAGYK